MLLGTVGASILGNILIEKNVLRPRKGIARAERGFNMDKNL